MTKNPSSEDTISPSRIVDFEIIDTVWDSEISLYKIKVKFTSPGDDLDDGTGMHEIHDRI